MTKIPLYTTFFILPGHPSRLIQVHSSPTTMARRRINLHTCWLVLGYLLISFFRSCRPRCLFSRHPRRHINIRSPTPTPGRHMIRVPPDLQRAHHGPHPITRPSCSRTLCAPQPMDLSSGLLLRPNPQ